MVGAFAAVRPKGVFSVCGDCYFTCGAHVSAPARLGYSGELNVVLNFHKCLFTALSYS